MIKKYYIPNQESAVYQFGNGHFQIVETSGNAIALDCAAYFYADNLDELNFVDGIDFELKDDFNSIVSEIINANNCVCVEVSTNDIPDSNIVEYIEYVEKYLNNGCKWWF